MKNQISISEIPSHQVGDPVQVKNTGKSARVLEIVGAVAKVSWSAGGVSIVPTRFLEVR